MKKSLSVLLAAFLSLAACQNIEQLVPEVADDVLSAHIEQYEVTKTVLGESNNILWSEDDQIVAFMKTSYGHKYQILSSFAGKTYADFSKTSSGSGDNLSAGMKWDHNVAYYPYAEGIECVKSDVNYTLDVVIPADQTYAENSFGNGYFPMVAVSEDNDITFKNICGGMKLQLKGTQKVTSITVQGKNNELLSGAATVTAYTDGETKPSITLTGTDAASKSVTLDCGAGVQLSESTVTEFIIALPPVVFTEGFVVIITDSEDNEHLVTSDRENEVIRSSLLVMPEVTLESSGADLEIPAGEYVNLSQSGTANSYIVSQKGSYKFSTVKGNSSVSVGAVASAEVLWETFGTSVTPNVGDLVKNASYSDGYITFQTADTFNEGNAVIAAKDASGNILWSWHIWLTDQPKEHVYRNNAGTMMDRNLGATSATPGDVEALGLLYQWGRKDPFLGSGNIQYSYESTSTVDWPTPVSGSSYGTVEFSIQNPTTYIKGTDWLMEHDDNLWNSIKSIYDPCPDGWKVMNGGEENIWINADCTNTTYEQQSCGFLFYDLVVGQTVWYPLSGNRDYHSGELNWVNNAITGAFPIWCSTKQEENRYLQGYSYMGTDYRERGSAYAIRCQIDNSDHYITDDEEDVVIPEDIDYDRYVDMNSATDLSVSNNANCYMVNQAGTYKFKTFKGNSQVLVGSSSDVDPVGEIKDADILWESFGTAQEIKKCDLITAIYYEDSYVAFKTAEEFQEGNAVIAVRDEEGSVLWSWHIWMTDEPKGQVYYNDAGTMMDRNLGATSAKPGDVEAQGLLYQWGRKDPFLGASSIDGFEAALSTIEWPESVNMDSNSGTIAYATANPTTYISGNIEWMASPDENRWSETKTIYDPCPAGWHVPLGGMYGLIAEAVGDPSYFEYAFDDINKGMNFSGKFGADDIIWYPAFNGRSYSYGDFASKYYSNRYYWFCNFDRLDMAFCMSLSSQGNVYPYNSQGTANALPVRCCKE